MRQFGKRLKIPAVLRLFVNDYRINLFEIAFLKEDQVKLFQSDFGIVADYFVQKRKYGSYRPEPVEFTHIQETLQLLSVMTGDHRFEEVMDKNGKGGPHNMCEVLDRVESRGIEKGIEKGIKKGIRKGIRQGENKFAMLMSSLFAEGRLEEAKHAAEDREYRHMLMKEMLH